MIRLTVDVANNGTVYVPVPCRGVVVGADAVWQSSTVEPDDTIIVSRETTAVCTITAVNTAGLVQENGVRNATNKDLVFDLATAAYSYIKLVANGAAGAAIVNIEFDDGAYVEQTSLDA